MIQSKELRVGNWVNKITGGIINERKEELVQVTIELLHYDILLCPIPLSPGILERIEGIIKHDNFYSITWGTNGVTIIKYDDFYKRFKIELGKNHYRVIDYLHELQNGFYFLSEGEELTITL